MQDSATTAVAHTIQLAVAPVFLLSGVAGLLTVLTGRLARVVDRGRMLEDVVSHATTETSVRIHTEFEALAERARLISHAITFCTITALLICGVIITLFVSSLSDLNAAIPTATLFVAAMVTLVIGLVQFLREIFLATATLRIGPH